MGLVRTEGVILRTYPFSETSKIVHAYTIDYGPQSLMAKGARRSKSRFGGSLETFTRLELIYYKKKTSTLNTLSQCSVIESFPGMSNDLLRFYAGSVCIDLVKRFTMPEDENSFLYRLLICSLEEIDSSKPDECEKHLLTFVWLFLRIMGYKPDFGTCASCGEATRGPGMLLAHEKAVGSCCRNCSASLKDVYTIDQRVGTFINGITEKKNTLGAGLHGALLLDAWRFTICYIRLHLHQEKDIASLASFLEYAHSATGSVLEEGKNERS